jgi:glycosyltransferase involved in cell wall biosynthesis
VTNLVKNLVTQKSTLNVPIEIILIDDASTYFKAINKNLETSCTYIRLTKNIGRSKIRNLFVEYANFPYLLFLDCDSLIISPNFLAKYITEIQNGSLVCCGGRQYPEKCPSKQQRLSWKYGVKRESKPAFYRSKFPNKSFMTNNFMIKKELLCSIKFDERITNYGHEDNPILNGEIETNTVFLDKTKLAIQNLVLISNLNTKDLNFQKEILLLNVYKKLKSIRLLILIFHKISSPIFLFCFRRGIVDIHLFNLYKLFYLFSIKKSR